MSTAKPVPETWELTGDDARATLQSTGRRRLVRDALVRFRSADGFSHARSLAFTLALVVVEGIIALVGLASALGATRVSRGVVRAIEAAAPGPAGRVLTDAVGQAHQASASHQYLGLVFGLLAALVTGATAMGQIERALNRLYGVEQDRPTVAKYGRALLLAVTAGTLGAIAFAAVAFGRAIGDAIESDAASTAWSIGRWPLGVGLSTLAVSFLFRWAPRRRQPAWSWLAYGAAVSVLLWLAVTAGLALFFRLSTSFGDTYGPLAGVIALMLWSLLSSVAVLFGAAVAAQLEAVRAGSPGPRGERKGSAPVSESVSASEPTGNRALAGVGPR